jgi:hypothetical protein
VAATREHRPDGNPGRLAAHERLHLRGLLAGVAAIIVGGRADAGFPNSGTSVLLAIAALVIGGASLTGGRGSVSGTIAGAGRRGDPWIHNQRIAAAQRGPELEPVR